MRLPKLFVCVALLVVAIACTEQVSNVLLEKYPKVVITLPRPMVTAFGKEVTKVFLPSGTGVILKLRDRQPFAQTVAADKANLVVSMGGYFFGGFETTNKFSATLLAGVPRRMRVMILNTHYNNGQYAGGVGPEQVRLWKQQDPAFRFYNMLFATTMCEPQFEMPKMSDWVLKRKNGAEALGVRRGHNADIHHVMDLGNIEYAKYFADFVGQYAKSFHADGVALDEIMWNGYWGVDINDLANYNSVDQIRQSCFDWLRIVNENTTNIDIIHQAFWPKAQVHTDGVWGETSFYSWFRSGKEYEIFYEKLDYDGILKTMQAQGSNNRTYVWAAFYERGNVEQLQYCLSTYLLGKTGDYTVFQPHPVYDGGYPQNLAGYDLKNFFKEYEANQALFDVDLGQPLGSYYTIELNGQKIWKRDFENGVVFCNPNRH